jgi:protein TonB
MIALIRPTGDPQGEERDMAYINQTQDPGRRAKAIIAVGAIHAVLAYALINGLGTTIAEHFSPPLIGTQIPLPPPPPPPEPKPDTVVKPTIERPVAPVPPIPIPQQGPIYDPFEHDTLPDVVRDPDPGPTVQPPRPQPAFTPKGVRPSNSPSSWISNDDYPARPLRDEAEGTERYRVIVGTNGRVSSCELIRSTGNTDLDSTTCRLITRRARFEAATDENGAKVLGSYTGTVKWDIPGVGRN